MNKTININLGGYAFHIDENAYEKLKHYLEAISRSLSDNSEEKKEIISDIEARISELLSEKITNERQVVSEQQIDDIIEIMGQPVDFSDGDEPEYISGNGKKSPRKLFRDKEDRFLGGVCSGLGHFFGIDSLWIRLFFILLVILKVSPIVYIILWILVPEAKTTSDKLQMKGEPVNIDNIGRTIRTEFQSISDSIDYEGIKKSSSSGIRRIANVIGDMLIRLVELSEKFIGFILAFIAGSSILCLIGAFFFSEYKTISINGDAVSLQSTFFNTTLPDWVIYTALFFIVLIPFIGLFFVGLRLLFSTIHKIRKPFLNKTARLSILGIWVVTLILVSYAGFQHKKATAYNRVITNKMDLPFNADEPIKIQFQENKNGMETEQINLFNFSQTVRFTDNHEAKYSTNIDLEVEKSNSSLAYIEIEKESQGKSSEEATKSAKKIIYEYRIENNTIIFNDYFLSTLENINKDEEVTITIYIPKNTTIFVDESAEDFIDEDNAENAYFIMTDKGLKNTEKTKQNHHDDDED